MNKSQIGENAGLVWSKLKDNRHWEYEELKSATGLTDRDLNTDTKKRFYFENVKPLPEENQTGSRLFHLKQPL